MNDIEHFNKLGVLDILLSDMSTKKNIVWATSSYASNGYGYEPENQIESKLITGNHLGIIKTRAEKATEEQVSLTRSFAEVFTPTWICKLMIDEAYVQGGWATLEDVKAKRDYIRSTCLEITCGEAPFIVNRYDASDGSFVPVPERIGVLDRKLKVVKDITESRDAWKKWATIALKSVYGYEYQGDNLLIARLNVLKSIEEAIEDAGWIPLKKVELKNFARIIAKNFWQMDGLNYCVPYKALDEVSDQLTLWDMLDFNSDNPTIEPRENVLAQTYDWAINRIIDFRGIVKGWHKMKFDFVIGNPPYQEEAATTKDPKSNGQKRTRNIFHKFQMGVDEVAKRSSVLIYPAGRWIHRSGKGMADFGLRQINDPHLSKLIVYPNADEVFDKVAIADGISIVIKNFTKVDHGFVYEYVSQGETVEVELDNPGDTLLPINPKDLSVVSKAMSFVKDHDLSFMNSRILPQKLYGIESNFVEENPDALKLLEDDSILGEGDIRFFVNDKAGKSGRATWFYGSRDLVPKSQEYIDQWQVIVSSANAGGQKRDRQLELLDNRSVFGRSRVALGSFETKQEAENFYEYVDTCIIQFLFLMTDEALSSLGKNVPDVLDYSDSSALLDYSKDLDKQLKELLDLTDDEYQHVINRVTFLHDGRRQS